MKLILISFLTISMVLFLCHGYKTTRRPSTTTTRTLLPLLSDSNMRKLTEELFDREIDSYLSQITLNINYNDRAPQPLLQVNDDILQKPTIAKMRALFDNYEIDASITERETEEHRREQIAFLEAVMDTDVMRYALDFLQKKGIIRHEKVKQRDNLQLIWFTLYSRGGNGAALGSSGFEHTFMSEVHNGKSVGLHNWIYFSEEEKAGRLKYKGYLEQLDLGNKAKLLKARFTHRGLNKSGNTFFIGTSPELEMAVYTICFLLRTGEQCPVSLGGKQFNIQSKKLTYRSKTFIATIYPEL